MFLLLILFVHKTWNYVDGSTVPVSHMTKVLLQIIFSINYFIKCDDFYEDQYNFARTTFTNQEPCRRDLNLYPQNVVC